VCFPEYNGQALGVLKVSWLREIRGRLGLDRQARSGDVSGAWVTIQRRYRNHQKCQKGKDP
jgi:hypothetical protein